MNRFPLLTLAVVLAAPCLAATQDENGAEPGAAPAAVPFEGRDRFVPTPVDAPPIRAVRAGPAAEDVYQLAVYAAGASPGQVVADVGAGDGRHVVALARAVGETGRVLATELDESRVAALSERVTSAGPSNVETIQVAPDNVGLPAGAVDVILLSDVFQFVRLLDGRSGQDKDRFLDSLSDALVPGGVVVVTYVTSSLMRTDAERETLLAGTVDDFVGAGFLPGRRWIVEDRMWPRAVFEFQWAGPIEDDLPNPGDEYMGRPVARTMSAAGAAWLTRDSRAEEEDTAAFLAALAVPTGAIVADVGCGVGYHSLPIARAVGPDGRVLAVDIQPEMLDLLAGRVTAAGLHNVVPILGTVADPRLPPDSCDLILLADTWHEVGHPERVLATLRRALRPGGRLALLEFRLEDDSVPIKVDHRMAADQVRRELQANGFRPASSYHELPMQHLLFFERDDKAER